MNIVDPKVNLWQQNCLNDPIKGLYDHIERCARICYRSVSKGTITSEQFVKGLIQRGHLKPLSHGTVLLKVDIPVWKAISQRHPWIVCLEQFADGTCAYATNLLFLVEYFPDSWETVLKTCWYDSLKYTPSKLRPTFYWSPIGRDIADEFARHIHGICMESTRYVNYNKRGMDFVSSVEFPNLSPRALEMFKKKLEEDEKTYNTLVGEYGCKPEFARKILPLDVATSMVQTGFVKHWKHFFKLRCAPDAHPDARFLANQARELFDCFLFNTTNNN